MYSEKSIRIAFVIVSLGFLWSLFSMQNYREKYQSLVTKTESLNNYKIDSLQHLVDSLDMENYPCQIELNRFQVAYEIFMKRNPKAASQYGDIISDETE
jgi:uncharacterized protein related to proFAR isomerase